MTAPTGDHNRALRKAINAGYAAPCAVLIHGGAELYWSPNEEEDDDEAVSNLDLIFEHDNPHVFSVLWDLGLLMQGSNKERHCMSEIANHGSWEILALVLMRGWDASVDQGRLDCSALHNGAARRGELGILKQLVELGLTHNGECLIIKATFSDHSEIVRYVLECLHWDIQFAEHYDRDLLSIAAARGGADMLKTMLDHGAAKTWSIDAAMEQAVHYKDLDSVKLLVRRGYFNSWLPEHLPRSHLPEWAAKFGDQELVELLVNVGLKRAESVETEDEDEDEDEDDEWEPDWNRGEPKYPLSYRRLEIGTATQLPW
ncbi:hypothetical protein HDU88_003197 [Geranomyces variabilis]|nr:hypothetical protein HDU88_003197 [Geranomyces variabilis]